MAQNTINIQVGANTSSFTSSVNRAFSKVPSGINVPINLPLGKVSSDLKQFERSLDAATARVISFTATTRILYSLGNAIKRLTSDSIKVEDAMARISSILKSTGAETDKLKNSLFSLANGTSTAFYEVAEAAEEFSRQGLSVAKTLEATNSALLISKLSGSNLKTTIEGVTAVMSTFNNESLGFVDVANKLSALDARFATSSAGLIEGLKRVGGVASDAGVSLDQTAAAITVLKQVTGRSESVLGNALKSIFVSLQSDKVQKDLKQIGVEVTDTTGEFRNLTDVITDLSKAFESLSDSQRSSITQKVAGKYQANAFSGLITAFKSGGNGQSSLFDKAVNISRDSENEATDRLKILNKTTASELTRLSNTVTKFGAEIGDKVTKPLISNLANSLTVGLETMKSSTDQFTNGLNVLLTGKLDDSGKSLGDAIIAGIGNALGGPGLALLGYALLKFTTRILKDSVGAVKSILDIKSAQDQVTLSTQQTAQFMPKLEEADLARIGRLTTIAAREAEILAILNQQYATYQLMQSGAAAATALFSNPGVSVRGTKVVKGKASGHMPEEIDAIYREVMDIRSGVGGATPLARPLIKTLNVGNGPERVVVNSDEKIIKNFAGSGQDAVFNRDMMGYAKGNIPSFATGSGFPRMPGTLPRRAYIPPQRPSARLYNNGSQIFPPPPSNGINPQTQALVDQLNANKGSSIFSRAGAKYNDFSQAGRRYSGILGTSAFALPFLGGAIGEKVGGSSGRIISSASQSLGTAALIGSINPLAGIAVGVAAGFNTLAEAGKEFSVDMDGLTNKLSKTSEEVKDNQNAFSNYATTFATFKDATSTGSAKDIENLSKQLGFFLSDIKDTGLRDKIKSTTDLADLQQLGFEQSVKDKAKLSDSELSAAVGKAAQDRPDMLENISNFIYRKKASLGEELLTSEASLSKGFAQKAVKSLDISKLSEETKSRILSGKRATYSDINNAVDPNTLLSSALSEGGSSLFNSSGFAGDLTQEIKKQLEATNFSKEKVGNIVEIKPLRDLIDLSVKNIQTNFISKQEKVSSALDILSNKIDLAGNSFGEVTKATLDYNVKLAEARSKFQGSNNELNSSFLDSARSIIKEQNLNPENTSRALDATNKLVANGDFKGFISELSDVFGKGFPTELEKILSDNLVERRKLSIQEVNTMNALKVNFKNSIDKLRAQQASKLYSNLDPSAFRENLDQYTSNLGLATSPRTVNKNIRSSFDINGNSFFDKDLNRRYSRRNVQVLDQNALRSQAIIDKVRAEESLGLRGIDLSPNADKRLVDAKKQEVEFARNQVRQATLDKLSQFQARSVGESAPIFFNSINSQYKKNLGTTTPLLTKDFQSEFQDKVAVSDFQGAYDSLQRQRLIAESSARGKVPLKDVKGADDIRAVFTELENLLKNTIQNSKLNTLIANETAKNEVRDKSIPAEMLSELRSINKLIGNSNKSLAGIESMFLAQTYSGKTNVLLGQRTNSLSGIEAIDKNIEKIRYDNRPYELVQKEREGITNRGASLAAELNDSIEKYNNSKDTNERNRQARRADTISSKIDENNRKLSEFQKRDSERKRYFDGGEGKISNMRDQRDSIINSANSKLGEELSNSIAPLFNELKPLFKSLDGIRNFIKSKTEDINAAFNINVSVNGSDIIKSSDFQSQLQKFIKTAVYEQIKVANGVPPKLIPVIV